MPKNMSTNALKILLLVLSILGGNVGTYFGAMSSMDKEVALVKQANEYEVQFLKFRIKKLEASSPEKLNLRMDGMQREIEVMSNNFKLIMDLL